MLNDVVIFQHFIKSYDHLGSLQIPLEIVWHSRLDTF